MLNVNIGKTTEIGKEDVMVIAHAHGLYGAPHEDGYYKGEQYYSYTFNYEELITDISMYCGIEFFKLYKEYCEVTTINILNERDYKEFLQK